MLTIERLIAAISLVLTAFGLGYAIGSKDNNKTRAPVTNRCPSLSIG